AFELGAVFLLQIILRAERPVEQQRGARAGIQAEISPDAIEHAGDHGNLARALEGDDPASTAVVAFVGSGERKSAFDVVVLYDHAFEGRQADDSVEGFAAEDLRRVG